MVRAVVFDVGETLVDETRLWGSIADAVGLPRLTVFGVIGGVIERGGHHREVFALLDRERVGWPALGGARLLPRRAAVPRRAARGRLPRRRGGEPAGDDRGVHARVRRRARLRDDIGRLGSREAGAGVLRERGPARPAFAPSEIAYVGDRVDNDVLPANRAGMVSVFLRRGPWGYLHATWPGAAEARIRIDSLAELPEALRGA